MARLPLCSGRQVQRALERSDFVLIRIVGSHHIMRHLGPPQITVTVPVHGNRSLKRATLSSIIKQSKLTVDDFVALL